MRVVNIRELKARLSAYLREVDRGETFLVTDRNRVVAQLSPPAEPAQRGSALGPQDVVAGLVALGCRPPLRSARPTDYKRPGAGPGLPTAEIDAMLDWIRGEHQ